MNDPIKDTLDDVQAILDSQPDTRQRVEMLKKLGEEVRGLTGQSSYSRMHERIYLRIGSPKAAEFTKLMAWADRQKVGMNASQARKFRKARKQINQPKHT